MTLNYNDAIEVIQAEIAELTTQPDRLSSVDSRGILLGLKRALAALQAVQEALQ